MKPFKIFFFVLAVLCAATSCSSDDDHAIAYKNGDMEGLWRANGSGTMTAGVDHQISTLIIKSIKEIYGENPTWIDGKTKAYYFDGENTGKKGVMSSDELQLSEIGRTNFTYLVDGNVLSINNGDEIELINIWVSDNREQLRLIYDLTDYYRNKEIMQKLLDRGGLSDINVNSIDLKKAEFHISFSKVANDIQ